MPIAFAHCIRATFPSQSTVLMGSSGRPVAQSITVWIPTNVAGIVSGLLKSACSTVAPQSRRKSAGAGLGLTRHLTS
nr:hypothetical protein Iba_scaffold1679039CG0010 [Ipomoea batatas]